MSSQNPERLSESIVRLAEVLGHDFQAALERQNADALKRAVDRTPPTELTAAASARLGAHLFLVREHARLQQLRPAFNQRYAAPIKQHIKAMDESLQIVVVEPHDRLDGGAADQLPRDDYWRQLFGKANDDKALRYGRIVADMPTSKLTTAGNITQWMQNTRNGIVERLWEVVVSEREGANSTALSQSFLSAVQRSQSDIEPKIPGSILLGGPDCTMDGAS